MCFTVVALAMGLWLMLHIEYLKQGDVKITLIESIMLSFTVSIMKTEDDV